MKIAKTIGALLVTMGFVQCVSAQSTPMGCVVTPGTHANCSSDIPSRSYVATLTVPAPAVTNYTWSYIDLNTGLNHSLTTCSTSVCYVQTNANGHDVFWDIYAVEVVSGRSPTSYVAGLDLACVHNDPSTASGLGFC